MRRAHAGRAPRESAPSSRKTHASGPLFGPLERHGAHRPRPHGDALHAGGGSGENVELEPMEREALTRSGNTPQRLRSEEHTSELQSRLHLVCRLLLEKKKT